MESIITSSSYSSLLKLVEEGLSLLLYIASSTCHSHNRMEGEESEKKPPSVEEYTKCIEVVLEILRNDTHHLHVENKNIIGHEDPNFKVKVFEHTSKISTLYEHVIDVLLIIYHRPQQMQGGITAINTALCEQICEGVLVCDNAPEYIIHNLNYIKTNKEGILAQLLLNHPQYKGRNRSLLNSKEVVENRNYRIAVVRMYDYIVDSVPEEQLHSIVQKHICWKGEQNVKKREHR